MHNAVKYRSIPKIPSETLRVWKVNLVRYIIRIQITLHFKLVAILISVMYQRGLKYIHYRLLVSPPENDSFRKDLCYSPDVFFFLQLEISEMSGPTGVKFCTMVSTRPNFIMPVQNFLGAHPKKISGAKNMQNLARFRTTSKFGGEYLRNGW